MIAPTLENLTKEKWDVVRELDRYVRMDLKWEPKELCYWYLLRFAIARNFHVDEAKKMLAQFVEFERGIAQAKLWEWGPPDPSFLEIQSNIKVGLHYMAKDGTPLLIFRLGESNIKELLKKYSVDQVINYFVQWGNRFINIVLPIASQNKNRRIEKLIVVFDFKGADMLSYLAGKLNEFVKKFADAGQIFYPNVLEKLYMINAPMLFSAAWAVLKYLLHPATQEKIEISSGNNKEKLLAAIEPQYLPDYLGGTSKAALTDNLGPWKKALDDSYVQKSFYLSQGTAYEDYFFTKAEKKSQESTIIVNKSAPTGIETSPSQLTHQDFLDLSDHIHVRQVKTSHMVVSLPESPSTSLTPKKLS